MAEINDKQAIAAEAQTAAGAASQAPLHIGIDVGSTTVKVAVLDDNNEILYSCYRRTTPTFARPSWKWWARRPSNTRQRP